MASPVLAQWTAIRLHNPAFNDSGATAAWGNWQGGTFGMGQSKPILWHSSSKEWINLAPGVGDHGAVFGMHGDRQVGQFNGHASLWSGTPESRIDLHPGWAEGSFAHAITDKEQVGHVYLGSGFTSRAALWHGSAASYIDLHPQGALASEAYAAAAGQQGGIARYPYAGGGTVVHAAMWSGTATSFLDLNPPGAYGSSVAGMSPGQQVGGAAWVGIGGHAGYWTGTPESFVDLNPAGVGGSGATATCGTAQVGIANLGIWSAVIWFGTAESMVNLHDFLAPGQYFQSQANAVAFHNGQYYIAGTAWTTSAHDAEAWLWIGVPTPGVLFVLVASGAFAVMRRRRS